jgi:hypothetical protein
MMPVFGAPVSILIPQDADGNLDTCALLKLLYTTVTTGKRLHPVGCLSKVILSKK